MSSSKQTRINEQIRVPMVRLIDKDGEQKGIVSIAEALETSSADGLDLVEISPNAEPPVCRIMDYGKYIFQQSKQLAAAKKKQKQVQVKEIKLRPVTEEGDYQVKLRNIRKFLEEGNKVKVTLRFRGREMAHQEIGKEMLERLRKDIEDVGGVESSPSMEGKQYIMVLTASKKK